MVNVLEWFLLICIIKKTTTKQESKVKYHSKLIKTPWKPIESLTIELKGLNFDAIWENIIKVIEGENGIVIYP